MVGVTAVICFAVNACLVVAFLCLVVAGVHHPVPICAWIVVTTCGLVNHGIAFIPKLLVVHRCNLDQIVSLWAPVNVVSSVAIHHLPFMRRLRGSVLNTALLILCVRIPRTWGQSAICRSGIQGCRSPGQSLIAELLDGSHLESCSQPIRP